MRKSTGRSGFMGDSIVQMTIVQKTILEIFRKGMAGNVVKTVRKEMSDAKTPEEMAESMIENLKEENRQNVASVAANCAWPR